MTTNGANRPINTILILTFLIINTKYINLTIGNIIINHLDAHHQLISMNPVTKREILFCHAAVSYYHTEWIFHLESFYLSLSLMSHPYHGSDFQRWTILPFPLHYLFITNNQFHDNFHKLFEDVVHLRPAECAVSLRLVRSPQINCACRFLSFLDCQISTANSEKAAWW